MAQTRPAPAPFGAADPQRPRIGILALQGDVREHAVALLDVGAEPVEVRLPRDLVGLDVRRLDKEELLAGRGW